MNFKIGLASLLIAGCSYPGLQRTTMSAVPSDPTRTMPVYPPWLLDPNNPASPFYFRPAIQPDFSVTMPQNQSSPQQIQVYPAQLPQLSNPYIPQQPPMPTAPAFGLGNLGVAPNPKVDNLIYPHGNLHTQRP